MKSSTLPKPECKHGYTEDQIKGIMGSRLDHYHNWAYGQTGIICTGKAYNHDIREYEPDTCEGAPHGLVTFTHDVLAYLEGSPPLD